MGGFLNDFRLNEFQAGENTLRGVRLEGVDLKPEDIQVWIEGDRVKMHLTGLGGKIKGHSWKKRWFDEENFDFTFNMDRGAFKHIDFDFYLASREIDGRFIPVPFVKEGSMEMDWDKISYDIATDNWQTQFGGFMMQAGKGIFLAAIQTVMNMYFKDISNNAISTFSETLSGTMGGGMIQGLVDVLPDNNIRLSNDIYLDYAMPQDKHAFIENGKMAGYFVGQVLGVD